MFFASGPSRDSRRTYLWSVVVAIATVVVLLVVLLPMFEKDEALPEPDRALAPSARNAPMASHNLQFVATRSNAAKPIRDIRGNVRVGVSGNLLHGAARTGCLGVPAGQSKICVRAQGFEAVSAPGVGDMYYVWPGENHQFGEQGFVAASDLKAAPALRPPAAPLAAPLGAAPGSPRYRVVVRPIHNTQGYIGVRDGRAHTFAPYGRASAHGGEFTLMTYNWTDVAGGGIARAAIAGGENFYPSDIDSLTVNTYPVTEVPGRGYIGGGAGAANGTVTVRYGRVNNGLRDFWGWMVTKHTTSTGECVDHMQLVGGAGLADSSCPRNAPTSASASASTAATRAAPGGPP